MERANVADRRGSYRWRRHHRAERQPRETGSRARRGAVADRPTDNRRSATHHQGALSGVSSIFCSRQFPPTTTESLPHIVRTQQPQMCCSWSSAARARAQKKAGCMAGLKIWGLNRTLKTLARPVRTPGGWGAEESGTRAGPGREATVAHVASQLGVCLAQMGPHYDSTNEAVMPAIKNAAAVAAWVAQSTPWPCCQPPMSARPFAAQEALAGAAGRRDHDALTTRPRQPTVHSPQPREAPDGYRRNRTKPVAGRPSRRTRWGAPAWGRIFARTRPRQQGDIHQARARSHSQSLWAQSRRRRVARLRYRFPQRPRGVFGFPPRLRNAALSYREGSAAGAPARRLQRDLGDRTHPAPRPRIGPRARRARPFAAAGGELRS